MSNIVCVDSLWLLVLKFVDTTTATITETANSLYIHVYDDTTRHTWNEANDYCQLHFGTYLASFHNEQEWNLLIENIVPHADSWNWGLQIGYTDTDQEGIWKWIDGSYVNTSHTESKWRSGEPNDFADIEECCSIYSSSLDMYDHECFGEQFGDITHQWACNKPIANPTISPTNQPTIPTNNPTQLPSIIPTTIPTNLPSIIPTNPPSSHPSKDPTSLPSVVPSTEPTVYPSNIPSSLPTNLETKISTLMTKNGEDINEESINKSENGNDKGNGFGSDPTIVYIIVALVISCIFGMGLSCWFYFSEIRPRRKNGTVWNSQRVKYIKTNGLSYLSGDKNRIELKSVTSQSFESKVVDVSGGTSTGDKIDANRDKYDININEGSVSGGLVNYISEQVVIKVENDKSGIKNEQDSDSDDDINIDQMYEFVQNANDFDAIEMNKAGTQTAMPGEETDL